MEFPIAVAISKNCFLDVIRLETCGQLTVSGWVAPEERSELGRVRVYIDSVPLTVLSFYRHRRPDVKTHIQRADEYWGFCQEYQVPDGLVSEIALTVGYPGEEKKLFRALKIGIVCQQPHYSILRSTPEVLHRQHIYGSGPPSTEVNPEVRLLASGLRGRVLDFGCGIGVLVGILREQGIEAEGIEIDRPAIAQALPETIRPHIRLYDGRFPLPYETGSFDYVIGCEVLEHIEDYMGAVREIARVARRGLLLTVPDMSAIPLLHKHNVVPWHLLESTHVNFFTQQSLARALQSHFADVQFFRMGQGQVNDTSYWVHLVALATHRVSGSDEHADRLPE